MNAVDHPMFVDHMANGQPSVRIPRGLVATMEAGSQPIREADAAEIARRWNTYPAMLAALSDLTAQCQKWAPTIDRSRAVEALALARGS